MKSAALLLLFLSSLCGWQRAQAGEKLELWPYIETAAIQEEQERKLQGVSYVVGGAVAAALPFVTTSSGSGFRDIGTYTLLPAGIFSILYGGYTLATDSSWTTLRKKVEYLSGPAEDSTQWRLRREAHSRQVLLERADSVRLSRTIWGGIEASLGLLILSSSQSAPNVVAAGVLLGLSAYHLLHKKAEERAVDLLERTTAGFSPERGAFIAYQLPF